MKSLQTRLGAGMIVALLVVFGLQWLLVSLAIRNVTEDYVATRLARDVDLLLAALVFADENVPSLSRIPEGRYDDGPYSGLYYQVQIGAVTLRSESLWDQLLPLAPVPPGQSVQERVLGPIGQPLLLLRRGFTKKNSHVTIGVAEDVSAIDDGIRHFQQLYLVVSIGFLLLLVLSQRLIVRRSLAPLVSARIDLEKVGRGDADMLDENVPAEVRPLVREINSLLALLARRLSRSRTLAGNLAHGLKTPLSLLMRFSQDPALEIAPEIGTRLREQTELMRTQVERELNRARLAGDGRASRRFAPSRDVPPLVISLRQIYAEKSPVIEARLGGEETWPADREDMLELVGNLADNACKWCRGRVRLAFGPGPRVDIEDDGPGGDLADRKVPGERGVRLDERMPGHGLGLAIARDIVDHYGGSIVFGRSGDLGGLRVTAVLSGGAPRP